MVEGNCCPEGYPVFKDGGLHENLLVEKGVYIVDRNGRVCITTTSNKWENAPEPVKKLNQGYIRARFLANEGDFLTYSNQIRIATKSEIEATQRWVNDNSLPYRVEETGQLCLF